ncbi:phenylalanine--tRNA ligase subunit beta [Campylobacter sp.]|uniref:phenylalanine--tRNA ligase subunit beta n=1 Tax=Campylobacter sp. TaxID=205 RepID=UPI0026DDC528|nr:phenylalanine--tRNA ligase subunit beta [Campylobacter sp.]MDO4674254.1 phenylalanine--tRNA ligase subunit beta [Campylobacter sp.]
MILTKSWLNEWIDLSDKGLKELTQALNSIGLEVDKAYHMKAPDRVVVGLVREKTKHENSEKLNITQVDVGGEILQIVCKAANVEAGQFVAVALEGARMPSGMEIQKTKLRGEDSCGMICSSAELGFAKNNEGILILDESMGELELGRALNGYELFDDAFIEVELTPNRGDCLSIYGVARDLSVVFEQNLKDKFPFKEGENVLGIGRILKLQVAKELNSLFVYRAVELKEKISTKLSSALRLAQIGLLSCDALENLLHYATHSTGVLFNAYDFDRLRKNDETATLNLTKGAHGETKILCQDKILSVSGLYQDGFARANESSKIIIIEAHYTEPSIIAASKKFHEKQDEKTFHRSFRGSEPGLTLGMDFLLGQISGSQEAVVYSSTQQVLEYKNNALIPINVKTINNTIGQAICRDEILKILKKLGFELIISNDNLINVKAPLHRSDIKNIADICEEVVRIVGIDNIDSKNLEFTEKNRLSKGYQDYKNLLTLRQRAADHGYFESLHYVLDHEKELEIFGFERVNLKLINPITAELNTLRTTLLNHLLNAASLNAKNSQKIIKLFESGMVFNAKAEELHRIAFVHSGLKEEPKISNKAKPEMVNFYDFLLDIKNIVGNFELQKSNHAFLSPYEQASVHQNGRKIGFVGRVHLGLERARDLAKSYVCELDLSALQKERKSARAYSKFPSVSRDLSILVPKNFDYETIKNRIRAFHFDILENFRLVDLYSDESLGDCYSLTINFIFKDAHKTLEEAQVNETLASIVSALEEYGLKLR